jgi:intracellular septation protein A
MAVANAAVLKLCTVETWVNFKVFGSLALSFVFVIFLAIYLSRHIEESDVIKPNQ